MSSWTEVGWQEEKKKPGTLILLAVWLRKADGLGKHVAPAASRWWRHMLQLTHICICVSLLQFQAAQVLQVWQWSMTGNSSERSHSRARPACCFRPLLCHQKMTQQMIWERNCVFPPDTNVKWSVCEYIGGKEDNSAIIGPHWRKQLVFPDMNSIVAGCCDILWTVMLNFQII